MSRYIDLDKTIEELKKREKLCIPNEDNEVLISIDAFIDFLKNRNAVTIIHAHWTDSKADRKHCRVCSNCGSVLPSDTSIDALWEQDNRFCYFCGAIMDEEEEI